MDSTAKRTSPFRVAAVVSFYMFAALVVCHLAASLLIGLTSPSFPTDGLRVSVFLC